jgi:iron complex outermembrane receptor protein
MRSESKISRSAFISALYLMPVFASPALAQEVSGAPSTDEEAIMDSVTVTAQRRSEELQDTPIAITAITSDERALKSISSINDVVNLVPGMSFELNKDRMSIRGVGRLTNTLGSDPGVAVYDDGFYSGTNGALARSALFVERIEVLRGPQGTLYGRNSIGGAANVISKRPDEELGAEAWFTVGSYDSWSALTRASIPVNESLRFSVSGGLFGQEDGYYENISGGPSEGGVNDGYTVELQSDADIGDSSNIWLKYARSEQNQRLRSDNLTSPYFTTATNPGFVNLYPNPAYLYDVPNPGVTDEFKINTDFPARTEGESDTIVAQGSFDLGPAELRVIGGYTTGDYVQYKDYDRTARTQFDYVGAANTVTLFPSLTERYADFKDYYSGEVNLISSGDGPLKWILGGYYYREDYNQSYSINAPNQPELSGPIFSNVTGLPAPDNPQRYLYSQEGWLETESMAAFGQLDWDVRPAITLTLGARYSVDEKKGFERQRTVFFDPTFLYGDLGIPGFAFARDATGPTSGQGFATRSLEDSWSGYSGVAGVQWEPSTAQTYYAKYTRGFKPGGFNLGGYVANPFVDSETVDAYEVGAKWVLQDNRLRINSALFNYLYEGAQTPISVERFGIIISEFVNIDESESIGFETEINWSATDNLDFVLSYSYIDAEIVRGPRAVSPGDPRALDPGAQPCGPLIGARQPQCLEGNPLPSAPKNKVALNALYSWDIGDDILTLSGTYTWKDETYYQIFRSPRYLAPAASQADFALTYRNPDQEWAVTAFLRNAFDETFFDGFDRGPSAQGNQLVAGPRPPRNFGVQLRLNF